MPRASFWCGGGFLVCVVALGVFGGVVVFLGLVMVGLSMVAFMVLGWL